MRHPHDTNKCKDIMKVLTKFHPKDIQLYSSICCKGRGVHATISKDFIGMGSYLERTFAILGIEMLEPRAKFEREKDIARDYQKTLKSSWKVKM
jgi:hypothetical protein